MTESGDSPSPRRLAGLFLVALAAAGVVVGGPLTASWRSEVRGGVSLLVAAILLAAHAALSPATLSYALMLDLRQRGHAWLQLSDPGRARLLRLHERTRWIDLTLPFVLTLMLAAAAWAAVDGLTELAAEASGSGLVLLLLVVLPLCVVVLPSRAAAKGRGRWERWTDEVILGLVAVLRPALVPLVWLVSALTGDGREDPGDASLPAADLADVIEVGSHQGDLSLVQSELLRREVDFARKTAAEVMVPRVAVEYLDIDLSYEAARERVVSLPHSRFPVEEGSVDHVVAVIHARQFLRFAAGEAPETLRQMLHLIRPRAPLHVRFDQPLEDVLEVLRREKVSLAIVDDAYGGVAGILTVEDVVEEIVGEIVDESDSEPTRETFLCSGRRLLAELAELGLGLPGEPTLSVAEFLAEKLGDELRPGQAWAAGGRRLVVEAVDAHGAVDLVRAELDLPLRARAGT